MGREGRAEKVAAEQDLKEGAVRCLEEEHCRVGTASGPGTCLAGEAGWAVVVALRLLVPSVHAGPCLEAGAFSLSDSSIPSQSSVSMSGVQEICSPTHGNAEMNRTLSYAWPLSRGLVEWEAGGEATC